MRSSSSPTGTALSILADEVYGDLGYDGPVPPLGSLDPDAPIISFSSLSKAYLAPGWRTGWLASGDRRGSTTSLAAIEKLADGRLCSTVPMQHAIAAALSGDRSHQAAFRAALKRTGGGHDRAPERDAGRVVRRADGGVLRDAEGGAAARHRPTKTSCSRCFARPASCACTAPASACRPADGFFGSCSSPPPDELHDIYDLMADFTARVPARVQRRRRQ